MFIFNKIYIIYNWWFIKSDLGLGQNQFRYVLIVRHVGHCEFHIEFGRDLREIPICATVHVIAAQDVVSGLQQLDHGRSGGQAGRKGQTVFATVQRSNAVLQHISCRVAAPAVLESLLCGGKN